MTDRPVLRDGPNQAELAFVRTARRTMHARPELSHEEYRTATFIERKLSHLGLRPFRPAPTSVATVVGTPGIRPSIGIRADLDALRIIEETGAPYASRRTGVMHACGHDGHAAALLGLARRLASRPSNGRSALLVFQQAEEAYPSGAQVVLEGLPAGLRPPEFYAFHLWPELPPGVVGTRSGPLLAAVAGVTFTVTGRPGRAHGTAAADGGIDALAVAVQLYTSLRPNAGRHLDAAQRSSVVIGRIQGGTAPNRVATECAMYGTIRALTTHDESMCIRAVKDTAIAVATQTGAEIDVAVETGIRPPVWNDEGCVDRIRSACARRGLDCVAYPDRPLGVSDDFGWYIDRRPGALFLLGCGQGPIAPDLHTSTFDFDESVLVTAIEVFEELAVGVPSAEARPDTDYNPRDARS